MTETRVNSTGDEHLVAALLDDPTSVRDAAVATITRRADGEVWWGVTADAMAEASVEVTLDGDRFGYLSSNDVEADTLREHAAWLGRWLKLAERHQRLAAEAMRDELTGVWNRRYFDRELSRIMNLARDENRRVTLLLFDVDDLKTYNDAHGHPAGDEILRDTALMMQSSVRPHDVVARIGGDEFAVIFWDDGPRRTNGSEHPHDVFTATARFRRAVKEHRFPRLGKHARGQLTVSGGLARYPGDADTPQQLFEVADERLLQAKQHGKNAIAFGPDIADIADSSQ